MTKYEIIYEALQEKVNNNEIDINFAEEVNDLAYEDYLLESIMFDDSYDFIFERNEELLDTNPEYTKYNKSNNEIFIKSFKEASTTYKDSIKKVKKLIKEKKYKNAKKEINKSVSDLKKLKTLVDETPNTLSDYGCVYLMDTINSILMSYTLASILGYVVDKTAELEYKNGRPIELTSKDGIKYDKIEKPSQSAEFKEIKKNIVKRSKPNSIYDVGRGISSKIIDGKLREKLLSSKWDKNIFKRKAYKAISKELNILKKLDKKIDKLVEKEKKN